jgi:hypothetical protein
LFSKAGLWGFLSVALLAGAGAVYSARPAPRAEVAPRVVPSTATDRLSAPAQAAPRARMHPPEAALPVLRARVVTPAAPRGEAALREEINVLDRAREALEQGSAQRALALLDQHRRRFAQGTLLPEAEAMRIEALVRSGETERAQRRSRQFLSAYPDHPLSERVGELTE